MRIAATVAAVSLVAGVAVAAPPGPAELARLTPADSTVVVGVNIAALRGHPAVQDWLMQHPAPWTDGDRQADEFLRDAGLDPLRDVNATVISVVNGEQGKDRVLALFSGVFDPSSLAAAMVKRGAVEEARAPFVLLRLEGHDTAERGYAGITPDIVAVGSESAVKDALTGKLAGSSLVQQEVAARHLDTRAGFWMAVNIPRTAREHLRTGEGASESMRGLVQASQALERLTVQANLGEDLVMKGYARADTPENAELVHDAVKGAIAALRLGAQETHPELIDVLRDVKVKQDGVDVSIDAAVPVDLLERMVAAHKGDNDHHGNDADSKS